MNRSEFHTCRITGCRRSAYPLRELCSMHVLAAEAELEAKAELEDRRAEADDGPRLYPPDRETRWFSEEREVSEWDADCPSCGRRLCRGGCGGEAA